MWSEIYLSFKNKIPYNRINKKSRRHVYQNCTERRKGNYFFARECDIMHKQGGSPYENIKI